MLLHVDTLTWFESDDGMIHITPQVYTDDQGHPRVYLVDERGRVAHDLTVTNDPDEVETWERDFDLINGAEIREEIIKWWNRPEHTCCDPI